MENTDCLRCGGKGFFIPKSDFRGAMLPDWKNPQNCPRCKGTGDELTTCKCDCHWRNGDSEYEDCPNCGAGRKVVFEAGQKGLADCADCRDEFVALYTKPELQGMGVPIPD
jgi:hypothetical protein